MEPSIHSYQLQAQVFQHQTYLKYMSMTMFSCILNAENFIQESHLSKHEFHLLKPLLSKWLRWSGRSYILHIHNYFSNLLYKKSSIYFGKMFITSYFPEKSYTHCGSVIEWDPVLYRQMDSHFQMYY